MKSGRYVEVLPGDTWSSLAKEFQITIESLKESNSNLDLTPGEWAFIPDESGPLNTIIKGIGHGNSWFKEKFFGGPPQVKLMWPVPASARISSGYGLRRRHFHEGIDIASPRGNSILAAADGKVIYSGRGVKGYGNLTIISHSNGYFTVYGHAQKNLTHAGDKVLQGQQIAKVGSTGRSTGPHLHFEVRHYDRSIDPMHFLDLPNGAEVASSSSHQNKDTGPVEEEIEL